MTSSLIDLVIHDWKQINLPLLRSELDEFAARMDQLSSENKVQRKELAKETKELKKCKKEEKLKKFGAVLKLYQQHIDSKENECKFIFESFLKIYKIVSEAPDPIDALQNGQIQILKLQSQLLDHKDMAQKLENYEKEFNNLKNQEITVKKLKEQMKRLESEQDMKINAQLIAQQTKLEQQFKNELSEHDVKYNECKLQLKNAQNEVIGLQQQLDELQNNLLSQSLHSEQTNDIQESTQSMLEEELERANMKIVSLSKQRDEVLLKLEQHIKQQASEQGQEMLDFELNTLKKRLSEAKQKCNQLQSEVDRLRKDNAKLNEANEANTKKWQENVEKLRSKIQRLPNEDEYNRLKEKVTTLQQQFLSNKTQMDDVSVMVDVDLADEPQASLPIDVSMETLLNTKLQSLQSELTTLRLDLHAKNNQLVSVQQEFDDVKQQCDEQKILINKLENDLTKYINPNKDSNRHKAATPHSSHSHTFDVDESSMNENDALYRILNANKDEEEEEKKVKEDSMITINISKSDHEKTANQLDEYGVMQLPKQTNAVDEADEEDAEEDDEQSSSKRIDENSAFQIVCEQRDRFRAKSEKLEQLKIKIESKLERVLSENAQLKQENVELYAKIKYLENYNNVKHSHQQIQRQQVTQRGGRMTKTTASSEHDEIEMKYENLYEESMNPFAQFRRREKEKRIDSLEWTEWIAFMVGSTVLSKRLFRLVTVFYAIALHLLIFFTMMHEYRSHGVFDTHVHCNGPPGIQIDISGANVPHIDGAENLPH
eukprot:CAMPEP_0197029194 /NCGR_PEP_ID=MMETSP1384-20130603/8688_1 /TAXON_ID=29189 /ORGANISM="Ammonia sp." /LENGTH=770 /DNA_ID=CAMNT_0042458315 /DNA_START=24 /DNA_END=2336 /DNA_ORIENTATION=-